MQNYPRPLLMEPCIINVAKNPKTILQELLLSMCEISESSPASRKLGNVMLTSICCNIDLRGNINPREPKYQRLLEHNTEHHLCKCESKLTNMTTKLNYTLFELKVH